MRRLLITFFCFMILLLPVKGPAFSGAALQPDPLLEDALSMLESGNPFISHYNQVTGNSVKERFPLGCPYLWGGKGERNLIRIIQAWQSSPGYYKQGEYYLYGFDCSGYIQWLLSVNSRAPFYSISGTLALPEHPELDIAGASEAQGAELSALLIPGDIVAISHSRGSYHVAMYIGTLRQYGYTADQLPEELKSFADYPLIIHCTVSSDYYIRYEDYIEEAYEMYVAPPDGGVIVSLLVSRDAAPYREINPDNGETAYFLLDGYRLQAYDLAADRRFRWVRWPEKGSPLIPLRTEKPEPAETSQPEPSDP